MEQIGHMNSNVDAPMVEDLTSIPTNNEDHLALTEDGSFMKENVIPSFAIEKTKDESDHGKEKSEAVSKVFCSLEENDEEAHVRSSWRDESTDYYESDEEDIDSEDDWSDEDEAAAEEWLKRHELREKGLLSKAAFSLPPTIKVSIVPLSEEEKQKHQQKQRAELGKFV